MPNSAAAARSCTILLVDDESSARRRMRSVLRKAGFVVIEAHDFQQGWAIYQARQRDIDMLLLDVSIPGNNGCELALAALAMHPSVKVLLMSGLTGAEVCRFYGISATDVHFLEKPFHDSTLLARVKYVLGSAEPLRGTATGSGA